MYKVDHIKNSQELVHCVQARAAEGYVMACSPIVSWGAVNMIWVLAAPQDTVALTNLDEVAAEIADLKERIDTVALRIELGFDTKEPGSYVSITTSIPETDAEGSSE